MRSKEADQPFLPPRPLPGEEPRSASRADAIHWERVYSETLSELARQLERLLAEVEQASVISTGLELRHEWLLTRISHCQARIQFWHVRESALSRRDSPGK